ncbi:MAG: OmpA family protein [Pseudomonadota bacterium]
MELDFSRFEIATGTGALFFCLVFVCVFVEASTIENGIAMAVVEALEDEPLHWVGVEVHGRSLQLTGAAPDAAARERALRAAAAAPGVGTVRDGLAVIAGAGACQRAVNAQLDARPIRFKSGRAELARSSHAAVAELAAVARRCGLAFEVAVHTDARGDAVLNEKLSQRRAEATVRLLTQHGMDPQRLQATGYGEAQPVADNASAEGRAANRRTELRVTGGRV